VAEVLERRTQELRESEARFRSLFEAIPEAIFVHEIDGVIRHANAAASHQLRWPTAELVGRRVQDLVLPEYVAALERHLSRAASAGAATFDTVCVAHTGRRIDTEVHARRLAIGGQSVILSVASDVTARNRAERERMDCMAMLAHDLRNPLGVVLGYADMLRAAGGLSADQVELVGRIEANIMTVAALVSDALDLAHFEGHRLVADGRALDVNAVLRRAVDQCAGEAARRRIAIELELAGDLPATTGDPQALDRVFGNLLSNALASSPDGGQVRVGAQYAEGSLVATVRDSGPGMLPADADRVFERYHPAAPGRRGTGSGLGLYIARVLVEAHGGSIAVQSTPGHGSTFTVTLPVRMPASNSGTHAA
jgi:PAS domain S-box-containing protein